MSKVAGALLVSGVLFVLTASFVGADSGHSLTDPPGAEQAQETQAEAQRRVDSASQDAQSTAAQARSKAQSAKGALVATAEDQAGQVSSAGGSFLAALRDQGVAALDQLTGLVGDAVRPPGAQDSGGSSAPGGGNFKAQGGSVVPAQAVPDVALVLVMAAGAAGGALLWVAVLQRAVLFGVVPLLSRIAHSEIYTNEARRLIGDLVAQTPGLSLNEIVSRTGFSRNAVSYHLFVLEKEEELVSVKDGKYRRYFTRAGKYVNGAKNVVSVLRNDVTLQIARRIVEQPGTIQRDLCALVGTTPSAVCWHIKRLEDLAVVRKLRVANTVQYYPGEAVQKYDLSEFGLPAAQPAATPALAAPAA